MKHFFRLVVLAFAIFFADTTHAKVFQFVGGSKPVIIGQYADFLLDSTGKLNFEQVRNSNAFKPCESKVPNFNITKSAVWLKVNIQNGSERSNIFLQLAYAVLDHVEFYRVEADGSYTTDITGEEQPVNIRKYPHHNFIFDLKIPPGESKTYLPEGQKYRADIGARRRKLLTRHFRCYQHTRHTEWYLCRYHPCNGVV